MKPETIKWIDRRVGVLICRLLSLLVHFQSNHQRQTNKLVFIKLIEQGASVLAYSALKEAVEKYGKENVYFLVFKENRPILDLLDVLDAENIIEINHDHFLVFFKDIIKALWKLRSVKVDSCIDMEFFSRASAIISFLSGARKRVGLHSFTSEHPYRGSLMTHRIHYNPYVHVSVYYKMLVAALEETPINEPRLKAPISEFKTENPKVKLSEELLESVKAKLSLDLSKKIILLNPNASDMLPIRKWPVENFRELLETIIHEFPDACIVFTGVEEEKDNVVKLCSGLSNENVINAAGKTSLIELMALYELSDVLITNDSGPAHFASLFNTNVIVMFGPETPKLFAPVGEHIHVIYKSLACSPCVNVFNHRFSPCKDNVCMKTIQAVEVFNKMKQIIS